MQTGAALTKAEMRLTEHRKYAQTGHPPRGMTCTLNINPFRPRDTSILDILAQIKKEYQQSLLDSLVTHYTRVVEMLEEDQVRAADREHVLRERFGGDPIWDEFDRIVTDGQVDSERQASSLFTRANRKRNAEGILSINPISPPKRSLPTRRPKTRRGRKRCRRKIRPQRQRARKAPEVKNRRLCRLRARIYEIKKHIKMSTVVNLSQRVLTTHEHSILHKGLSFCPTPLRPSKRHLLTSVRAFVRKVRLQYYFTHQNPMNNSNPRHPYKPKSSFNINKVRNTKLEGFITALQSHVLALKPKRPRNNVTPAERQALKALASYKDIIIKKADKGSCIVVEDTFNYKKAGYNHLQDLHVYQPIREDPTPAIVLEINNAIEHFYKHGPLDYHTRQHLIQKPDEVRTQLLYFLKKLHKNPHGVRPICSGSGGPTELISALVDSYLSPIVKKQPSYIRDSSHLIKMLETLILPQNVLLVSLDVTALYPSIPQDEAIEVCASFAQKEYNDPGVTNMIRIFLYHILKNNAFLFNNHPYLQLRGTAMGTRTAPSLANLFMANFEQKFLETQNLKPLNYFRFIDDILLFWPHPQEQFDSFMRDLNSFHPTIKFTHAASTQETTFLDIDIFKGDRFLNSGILDIKTHIKQTNKFQYLYHTSSHPKAMKTSVVKGELHRFLRSTSDKQTFLQTQEKQKIRFRNRGYPLPLLQQINQEFPFERRTQLIAKIPDISNAPDITPQGTQPPLTLVMPYDPWFPTIRSTIHRLWNRIAEDDVLKQVFPTRPKIAYKRTKNLSDTLVRAKLPTTNTVRTTTTLLTPSPTLPTSDTAIRPCTKNNCKCCHNLRQRTEITSYANNKRFPVEGEYTCTTTHVIYMLECPICGKQYVGQTTGTIAERLRRHRLHFHQHRTLHLYKHFHDHGWTSFDNMWIQPIDYVPNDAYDLSHLEQQWITRLGTRKPRGLNAKDERLWVIV